MGGTLSRIYRMSLKKYKKYLYHGNYPLTKYAKGRIHEKENNKQLPFSKSTQQNNITQPERERNIAMIHEMDFDEVEENELCHPLNTFVEEAYYENNPEDASVHEELCSSDDEVVLSLKKNLEPYNSIKDVINEPHFLKLIFVNVERSPAELLLIILKYSISNSLSMTGISNLLHLVNCICGKTILPETRYKIDKLCNSNNNVTMHGMCQTCTKYIGTFSDFNELEHCTNCNTAVDMSNPSNECFFVMIDPSDGIRDYLEIHENYYDYTINERQHEKNHLKDIYDGQLYRNFIQSLNELDRHAFATVIFNTDGAPVFKSSCFSIWPIYLIVNEIPAQFRLNSAITTGLWFGRNKPEMSVFLDIFVNLMNNLSIVGIPCNIKSKERIIKIYTLLACVDSVARAPMNGTIQFNGNYGCDWCLQEGHHYEGSMRYAFEIPISEKISHAKTIDHAREAVHCKTQIFGVKTASPLLNLNNFDIIKGFVPDYMHCYVAGVVRQFTELILKYLRVTDIQFINELFKKIKAPYQIGRLSRVLNDRAHWKAREYENWALYYSIPLLGIVLKNHKIMQHWSLLVESLHILLRSDINFTDLNRANEMLHKFVSNVENLYGLTAMTYNVHQLLHIVASVYNWGPLYAHSTYPFESANHKLLKSVHGAKGVVLQIVRHENIERSIKVLEKAVNPDFSIVISHYCENLLKPLSKNILKVSSITYFGKSKKLSINLEEKFNLSKKTKVFNKIVIRGCLFTTSQKENKRSCNYYAQLLNGTYVKLLHFIVGETDNKELTICQVLGVKHHKYTNLIKNISRFSHEICIETNQISKTCIFIKVEREMYIIPTPNQLYY